MIAHRLKSSNGSFDYRKNYIFNFLTGQEGEFQEGEFVFSLVSFSSVCLWWIVTEIIERKIQHFFLFFLRHEHPLGYQRNSYQSLQLIVVEHF